MAENLLCFLFYWPIVLSVKHEGHPVLAQRLKSGNPAFLKSSNIFGKVQVNRLVKRCCSVLVDSLVLCISFYALVLSTAHCHPLHEPSDINPQQGCGKGKKQKVHQWVSSCSGLPLPWKPDIPDRNPSYSATTKAVRWRL